MFLFLLKTLVTDNYWLDNYTVEGAKKQLEAFLDYETRGIIHSQADSIVMLVDDFYKLNPLMQPFDGQLDVTWRMVEAKNPDGNGGEKVVGYFFLDIKVTIIEGP